MLEQFAPVAVIFGGVFVASLLILQATAKAGQTRRRVARLPGRGRANRARPEAPSVISQLLAAVVPITNHLLRNSKLRDLIIDRKNLSAAGLRDSRQVIAYASIRLLLMTVAFGVAFAFFYSSSNIASTPAQALAYALGCAVGAFLLPSMALDRMVKARKKSMQLALPDTLDLMVICAEAGLSLDAALTRVAGEIHTNSRAMAEELQITCAELGFLPDRKQALLNFAERVAVPSIRGVVNTLIQSEKYGTPISQSLRVLSAEFRDTRMLAAEEKAARLPAILTVPMILFILPTLFVVLAGPAVIEVYDNMAGQ